MDNNSGNIEEAIRRDVENGSGLRMGDAIRMLNRIDALRKTNEAQAKRIEELEGQLGIWERTAEKKARDGG